ncbi:MAG: LuxR C-terminal-related transcriptional regulator [Coxiellaceae bacterium]|nr:LuxR C-terminal-related transcriptional regulator [Coxiellaceae bacterium]
MTFSHYTKPTCKSSSKKSRWDDVLNEMLYKKLKKATKDPSKSVLPSDRLFLKPPYQGKYLTPKQRLILLEFLQQKTSKRIAQEYNLSERTIEDYSKILREKFDCANRHELLKKLNHADFLNQLVVSH